MGGIAARTSIAGRVTRIAMMASYPARILFSARDVGAALNLAEIIHEARARPELVVRTVASEPAFDTLVQAGVSAEQISEAAIPDARHPGAGPLLSRARSIVEEWGPQAVFVGLSGPDAGIDEALLVAAREGGIPTYAFQDSWGDLNTVLDVQARRYFVLDEEAARITRLRGVADAVVVGAPKYARYAELDTSALRRDGRALLAADSSDTIVGFFGQPLGFLRGYLQTAAVFSEKLQTTLPSARRIYVPHPRESADERLSVLRRLSEWGDWQTVSSGSIEARICPCDVVATPYSTCGYDTAMLNYCSPQPLGSVLYLMFDRELRTYYRRYSHLEYVPPTKLGLAVELDNADGLADALISACSASHRERMWRAARTAIQPPDRAAERVVEGVMADLLPPAHAG